MKHRLYVGCVIAAIFAAKVCAGPNTGTASNSRPVGQAVATALAAQTLAAAAIAAAPEISVDLCDSPLSQAVQKIATDGKVNFVASDLGDAKVTLKARGNPYMLLAALCKEYDIECDYRAGVLSLRRAPAVVTRLYPLRNTSGTASVCAEVEKLLRASEIGQTDVKAGANETVKLLPFGQILQVTASPRHQEWVQSYVERLDAIPPMVEFSVRELPSGFSFRRRMSVDTGVAVPHRIPRQSLMLVSKAGEDVHVRSSTEMTYLVQNFVDKIVVGTDIKMTVLSANGRTIAGYALELNRTRLVADGATAGENYSWRVPAKDGVLPATTIIKNVLTEGGYSDFYISARVVYPTAPPAGPKLAAAQ